MRVRTAMLMLLALVLALPTAAQEQRGSIEGTVKDAQGGVLPGATVEARSAAGAVLIANTDNAGGYRIPGVPPGTYDVTAKLTGFSDAVVNRVEVALGQIKKVNLTLAPAGVTEQVQVRAESPLIAVTQSERNTHIRGEMIAKIPKGRDFSTVVIQAPGTNFETRSGGISIDGSSASENRYIIDGVEVTQVVNGTQGKNLITDFIEEVQVKSSGYPAEYGGSTGGVINVLTKSGTNQWRGDGGFYFTGDATETGRRPTLRLKLANSSESEHVTFSEDDWTSWEPGFTLGGPIVKDRLWFFTSYQPAVSNRSRTVTLRATGQPLTRETEDRVHNSSSNLSAQLTDKLRGRVAFNLSPSTSSGLLPALDGSSSPQTDFDVDTKRPNYTLTTTWDYVPTNRLYLSARAGYFFSDVKQEGIFQGPQFTFVRTNIGMTGVPADLQRTTGFQNELSNFETRKDEKTRLNAQIDSTYYGSFGGQHAIKGGVQLDQIGHNIDAGETGNRVLLFWGDPFRGRRGPFGYYRIRHGAVTTRGFTRFGDVKSNNVGLFIQDSWTINNRLTLNLGLRTENEHVPSFVTEATDAEGVLRQISSTAIKFNFKNKLAPRVGFAYDIKGDGRWKTYASWGVFYDIMKLVTPRESFGGAKWQEYWFTLDTPDWPNLVTAGCPPACPGSRILGPVDFRHPSNAPGDETIDPDLDPMKLQEFSGGLEHQFRDTIALSVRYVHKQIDKAIEDVGALDADQNEIYRIANPGFATAAVFFPADSNQQIAFPKAVRDYDGVEFAFTRILANNWALRASYLWSRLYGNYSGLSQSDENGRTDPNIGRNFDYPLMSFNERGESVLGVLATDRTHQFKTQFLYDFPFGTSVGVNQYVASGVPVTREAAFIQGNNFPVMYLGRNSDGRTPVFSQTDLYLQHEIRMGDRRVQLSVNVLNLFDQDTVTNKWRTQLAPLRALDVTEVDFYRGINAASLIAAQGIPNDPRFLLASEFQSPLVARFGVKFLF